MTNVVGIDIGGTKIQAVILRANEVHGSARSRTAAGTADELLAGVLSTVDAALDESGLGRGDVGALGVGFPGQFDALTGDTLYAVNLPGLQRRYPLGARLSAEFKKAPLVIDNDVRAALTGEHRLGSGRPYRNMLGVFAGTGVGGGLILEGKLRLGRGAAGEIGHTVVKDNGRACGCGRRGCMEAYAGRARMELRARQLVRRGKKTILFDLMKEKGKDRLTSGVFEAALQQGDAIARALVAEAVWALGLSLASIQNALDLEAIIIGGGLGDRLGADFREGVQAAMMPHLFMDRTPPVVLGTELGDLSGGVGAALQASDHIGATPPVSSRG